MYFFTIIMYKTLIKHIEIVVCKSKVQVSQGQSLSQIVVFGMANGLRALILP